MEINFDHSSQYIIARRHMEGSTSKKSDICGKLYEKLAVVDNSIMTHCNIVL